MSNNPIKTLSIFSIVMITITSIDNVRNLPATAVFGTSLIIFFILAGVTFLIPAALVSAELATGWPEKGGIYVWVREAFGEKMGFLAIWFQWVENVFYFPTILSFIAGSFAYTMFPEWAGSRYYMLATILIVFWGITFLNMAGIQLSALFTDICGLFGLVLPMICIIGMGIAWIISGHPMQISLTPSDWMPDFTDTGVLVSVTAVMLSLCGMEIAAVHANDVKNPRRDYPIALFISTVFIIITMVLGSISLAVMIPKTDMSLTAGLVQAIKFFFNSDKLHWLTPVFALLVILGSLGTLNNWVIAPIKGLSVAIKDNQVLSYYHKDNSQGVASRLLLSQAILVSLVSCVFLLMPSINSSFWILTTLAAQLYMIMYVMLFITAIYLRYKRPDVKRAYKIPFGNVGIWGVALVGLSSSLFTIVIGFFPPKDIDIGNVHQYILLLIFSLIFVIVPPILICLHKVRRERRGM